MSNSNSYASRLVNFMLTKEQVFIPFQSCYYLLYQCLVPDTREALSLLVQHYSVPKDFERTILSGGNPRVCNQGILNYLLIKLRTKKDYVKFWSALLAMINHPELRVVVEQLKNKKGLFAKDVTIVPPCHLGIIAQQDDLDTSFPNEEGAFSVTDNDDGYCISYTVTVLEVRSCARPLRPPCQQRSALNDAGVIDMDVLSSLTVAQQMLVTSNNFAELQSHYSVLVRSMPDDYMNTVSQLERHLTGDHIGSILECADVSTANQRILDCLVEQLEKKEDLFDLCSWLGLITDAPLLTITIEDLKIDVIKGIKMEDAGDTASEVVDVEASLNSLKLNDLSTPRNMLSPSVTMTEPTVFNNLEPGKYGPKALGVLKKHYNVLWRCFPDDYMLTLTTMCEECNVNERIIQMITLLQSPEQCNRTILDYVICSLNGDDQMIPFSTLMEKFINNSRFSKIVSALKKDCTDVMLDGWMKNILGRRTETSPSSNDDEDDDDDVSGASGERLLSTAKPVTTFRENVAVVTTESSSAGDGHPQQDGGDVGASVIDHLPAGVSAQCRTMLHSYYDALWQSFPQDHLITLSRLCDLLPVEERLMETIASYSSSEIANKRILNAALSNLKHDSVLLGFCILVEKLIEDPAKSKVIEKLRSDCLRVMEKKSVVIEPPASENETTLDEDIPIATPVSVESDVPSVEQVDENSNNLMVDTTAAVSDQHDAVSIATAATAAADSVDSHELKDPDPVVLHVLPSAVSAECIVVLKKYYSVILNCLPDNYVNSITVLSENAPVNEAFFNEILSLTDGKEANRRILNNIILMMKNDGNIIGVCKLVRTLIGSKQLCKEILEFESECLKIADRQDSCGTTTSDTNTITITDADAETASTPASRDANNNELAVAKQSTDVEPFILQRLSFSVTPECRLVLKRYYNFLWKNFPQDHLVSLGRLCKLVPLSDDVVDDIVSSSSSEEGNQKLLNICVVMIETDESLPRFCNLVDKIIDNPKLSKMMKIFRDECEKVVEITTERTLANSSAIESDQTASSKELIPLPDDDKQTEGDNDPKIFNTLFPCRLNANEVAVLKKHYNDMLKNFPSDHMISLNKLCQVTTVTDATVDKIISCPTSQESNREILDTLIGISAKHSGLTKFCNAIEKIVGSRSPAVESLRSDCLKVLEGLYSEQDTSCSSSTAAAVPITTSSQQSTPLATDYNVLTTASSSDAATAEDTKVALRTFDEYMHLMTLIEPQCIQEELQTANIFPNNNIFISATTESSSILMEKIVSEVRCCIELNGAQIFLAFVNVLQAEGRYVVLGYHIFNAYSSHGGHGVLNPYDDSSTVLSRIPIADLSEQLKWHQRQIQEGLQYQCPMPLPHYYIQRNKLLEAIIKKLTEDDSISAIGITVNINGVCSAGKSTLAKALCHDVRLRSYFLDGFLWIRLGPVPVSPAIKLGQLYHLLTNKTEVGNQTFFTDKLQSLVANHLHKLLVIIDDVWEVSDALVYTQVFNGCKIVMTTRSKNVDKFIPFKTCISVEQMNEEEALKLLTHNLPKQTSVDDANYLVQNMNCWPLLLDLIGCQLISYCTKHKKPVEQAMDYVENILAIKPSDDDISKSISVVIKSSMELLAEDEIRVLEKLVLSVGCYMPIPMTIIPTVLKISKEEANRICTKLLELRLLSQYHLTSAPNHKTVLCYGIHLVAAEHIFNQIMFNSPKYLTDALDLVDFVAVSKVLAGGDKADLVYHCLATITVIDTMILPTHIWSLFAIAKCLQHEINDCTTKLSQLCTSSGKPDLVCSLEGKDTFSSIEALHEKIREDCRGLHKLLAGEKHDEAVQWLINFVKSHPLRTIVGTFTTFIKDLLNQFQDDQPIIASIKSHSDSMIQFYKAVLLRRTEHTWITLRRGLTAMINSGEVTSQQYQNLLDCHTRDMEAFALTD